MALRCEIALPRDFHPADVLAFHRRDPQQLAERVEAGLLRKGIAWEGRPACLTIRFEAQRAELVLAIDGLPTPTLATAVLERLARRMLGLMQPVAEFEHTHARHPQLGPLIARNRGLRVPLAPTPFEALSWAITGQQISLSAAVSLRRRLIAAAGLRHSGGLACYPDARSLLRLGEETLRAAGFSRAKGQALRALADAVMQGRLPLERWVEDPPADEIRTELLRLRGIGPWTVDYALLRGFGWVDGSLHGDAAVRRGLQALLGTAERPSADQTRCWLAPFSPWRALVAAHLWTLAAPA
ncbi:DNA-3-methyladenine glycosylase 2 [Thauera chlorobenzoica]|uniref:DNA-3-methyladenine glycosylase II n=1 Tax=Thauera chlorobenzoica TaxID=96773 RepID=A0A1H5YHF3_9RHOO|nr:AlkA N-terminal domain-containing protein [Thauera chlorobenzoica]APR05979.1 DNA-3-methyladenine glycosylase II [Thauera chlorobenzoica]SEG23142.1 DNA-3-methyladenine glycosylase II [Thauera chlorobenzoica]